MNPDADGTALLPWVIALIAIAAAIAAWGAIQIGLRLLRRHRDRFTQDTSDRMREMFVFVDVQRLYLLQVVLLLALLAAAGAVGASWPVWLGLAAAGVLLPRLVMRRMRRRRLEAIEQQLPDGLLVMAGSMRAGTSLTAAVQQLVQEGRAPLTQEFALLLREQRLGVGLDQALVNLDARVPLQSMTLAVAAMRVSAETGGGLAEALERVAATLRSKLAMEGKIRALTSQGRMQALIVGLLPAVLMLVLMQMEPDDMGKLFTTQIGWAVLAVLVLLETFGILLIRKIVSIDV